MIDDVRMEKPLQTEAIRHRYQPPRGGLGVEVLSDGTVLQCPLELPSVLFHDVFVALLEPLVCRMVGDPLHPVDGNYALPNGPRLGVTVDEERLHKLVSR